MTTVDRSLRLVSMQFSFSNENLIPASVKEVEHENLEEQAQRKARETSSKSAGTCVIDPIEDVSLAQFLDNLEPAGYEMVDAFYQPRPHPKNPHVTYHMVRFLFARNEYVDLSEYFAKVRGTIREELVKMTTDAMWRVRVFLNPHFREGEVVEGQHTLSLNLEGRKPFFLPDGSPVTVWQKDENGERVGDAPLPLRADRQLVIDRDVITIVPFSTER